MIKKATDIPEEYKVNMKGGPGKVYQNYFATKDELLNNARLFGTIVLEPDCGIGEHTHKFETEIFYVLEGSADYIDGGQLVRVDKGDVLICKPGESHAITNNYDETCKLIALIVLQ